MNTSEPQQSSGQCENYLYRSRIVHIHPTLRCNLACKHCYSSSLPTHSESLELTGLKNFLRAAYKQGYNAVSVSGGEPFLYKKLAELLEFTKSTGFKNVVASNGMLLGREPSKRALDFIDVIALSVDGKPELHNEIRCSERAFKKMLDGVEIVKSKDVPLGFIHTVTSKSWESILWLGEFADRHGAKLLQLHPLEMYGRAVNNMGGFGLDQSTLHKVFVLANYVRSKYQPEMFVQLDLLHRDYIRKFPKTVNVLQDPSRTEPQSLSDILNTIIVDEKGDIIPIGYGFSKQFKIGNIKETNNWEKQFDDYIGSKAAELDHLFRNSYQKILDDEERDLVNWNELIIRWSHHIPQYDYDSLQPLRKSG